LLSDIFTSPTKRGLKKSGIRGVAALARFLLGLCLLR
jgi:hypothetical protein